MAYKLTGKDQGCIAVKFVEWKLKKYQILMFAKSYCPEGKMCHRMIQSCRDVTEDNYDCVHYEKRGDCAALDDYLWKISGEQLREGPRIFIRGDYLGGFKKVLQLYQSGKLQKIITNLKTFPLRASNFMDKDKSRNLALEGEPYYLPGTVLKLIGDGNTATSVRVLGFKPNDTGHIDYDHFVSGRHSSNTTKFRNMRTSMTKSLGSKSSLLGTPSFINGDTDGSIEPYAMGQVAPEYDPDRSVGARSESIYSKRVGLDKTQFGTSKSILNLDHAPAMGPVLDSLKLRNKSVTISIPLQPHGSVKQNNDKTTPVRSETPSAQPLPLVISLSTKSHTSHRGSENWSRTDTRSSSQVGSKPEPEVEDDSEEN